MRTALNLLFIILFPFLIGVFIPEKKAGYSGDKYSLNPGHLDGPFTGGFGEQTCHSCHFDYDLNQEGGSLTIDGLKNTYQPGKKYTLHIKLKSKQLQIGGFQMTSRFEDGTQAGSFDWDKELFMLTPTISDEIQYLQHSREGTAMTDDRKINWSFTWQAPENELNDVIFNVAANAGNNDDSAFGDWIYVKEIVVEPSY
jgi:hypothetical protein